MKFYFLDRNGAPISYEPANNEFSVQAKGKKDIITMKAEFWETVATLGGIVDLPEHCATVVAPTSDNLQTIGVKFAVKAPNGSTYVGFGSSNNLSTTKISKTFQDYETKQDKTVYSGSACYALEMAVKRAKKNAIACALGLPHGEVPNRDIYSTIFIQEGFGDKDVKQHIVRPDNGGSAPTYEKKSYDKPAYEKPAYQQTNKPASTPVAPANRPTETQQAPRPASNAPEVAVTDPEIYVITIGKHKGRTLLDMINGKPGDRGWLKWALENTSNPTLIANIKAIMAKYGSLFEQEGAKDAAPSAANFTNTTDHRELLRKTWTARGYETNTPEGKDIVKSAIETALNSVGLKWEAVTDEQAQQILSQIDVYFPQKTQTAPMSAIAKPTVAADSTTDAHKCADCGKSLKELEVQFCKDNALDGCYCFDHQSAHIKA